MAGEIALSCAAVGRTYRLSDRPVDAGRVVVGLAEFTADFRIGEMTAVVGPSGSGKSTLLRLLAGVDMPSSGGVYVGLDNLARLSARRRRRIRRRNISFVFQNPSDNLLAYLRAREHVELAARLRGVDPSRPVEHLARVGIEHRAEHLPAELSSGEQQLVALAAAVVGDPQIVIADEPSAELDDQSAAVVIRSLDRLRHAGSALVVATHDPDLIAVADHVVRLRHGRMETTDG